MKTTYIALTVITLAIIISGLMAWGMMVLQNAIHDAECANLCNSNIQQLVKGAQLYYEDFGTYPPLRNPDFFTAIYNSGLLRELHCYQCCLRAEKLATDQMFRDNDPRSTDYECRTLPLPLDTKSSPVLFWWEKKPFHAKGRYVVFGTYKLGQKKWKGWYLQVERISEAQFAELVKQAGSSD